MLHSPQLSTILIRGVSIPLRSASSLLKRKQDSAPMEATGVAENGHIQRGTPLPFEPA